MDALRTEAYRVALDGVFRAFEVGRMAQAYIVEGSPQGDAQEFACDVASLLSCTGAERPCGFCRPCREVRSRAHPDVSWIEPQKKSRVIGIHQIRDADRVIHRSAFAGGWKVCVISDADRLGVEAANALLKTLEEPPPRTLFLLLTASPQALLATVRSRCQRVHLSHAAEALPTSVREALMEIIRGASGEGLLARTAYAGRLLALLKNVKQAVETAVQEEASAHAADEDKDTLAARVETRYRLLRRNVLQSVILWERDVLMATAGVAPDRWIHRGEEQAVRQRAAQSDTATALATLQAIQRIDAQLERNMPEQLVFEHAFQR